MKQGLLLVNLGTPDRSHFNSVGRFLKEFLSDKRVIDVHPVLRYLLLYGYILPFRTNRTAKAYQKIWTTDGSPLLYKHSLLVKKLQQHLGQKYFVALGMRYGKPTISNALLQLESCSSITILPLYPQYTSATTGSSIEQVLTLLGSQHTIPSIRIIRDFFSHPSYVQAQTALIKPYSDEHEHILFSYHGIPERQLHKAGCKPICTSPCLTYPHPNTCYRAQCFATTELITQALKLPSEQYSTSFQSRLGKAPWIKPYTDDILIKLIEQGVKRLAIVCPSFVTDCLETLEEIGIRANKTWVTLGGAHLTLIPCLNDNDIWINALADIVQ